MLIAVSRHISQLRAQVLAGVPYHDLRQALALADLQRLAARTALKYNRPCGRGVHAVHIACHMQLRFFLQAADLRVLRMLYRIPMALLLQTRQIRLGDIVQHEIAVQGQSSARACAAAKSRSPL
jgi:hypothetical protein